MVSGPAVPTRTSSPEVPTNIVPSSGQSPSAAAGAAPSVVSPAVASPVTHSSAAAAPRFLVMVLVVDALRMLFSFASGRGPSASPV
jgi:hypothetical protein